MKHSMFIHFNATPLQQQVEDRHQKSQPHLKILPHSMGHSLAVTHSRQQRKDALDHHPHIPCAALTNLDILWVAGFAMKSCIGTDNHSTFKPFQQRMKFRVRDVGGGGLPGADRSPLIQHHTEFAANNPARIRFAFLADALTLGETQFSDRMTELNAKRISDAEDGRFSQKSGCPGLMGFEQAKQTCALWQMRKQRQVVALEPAIEMS